MMNRIVLVGLVGSSICWANGGGYYRGGVESAGDVAGFEPENTKNVRILDEKLTIRLHEDMAKVDVRYRMKNLADEEVEVRFGFPIEQSRSRDEFHFDEADAPGAEEPERVRDYTIQADDEGLEAEWRAERRPADDERFEGIAGWMVSEAGFGPGQERTIRISFGAMYPESESFVSENTRTGPVGFRYRLSTGAVWGGTIGSGEVVLEPAGIDPGELRVIRPVNRFEKEGAQWIWRFEDLEPKLADDLEIEVRPEIRTLWGTVKEDWLEGRQRISKRGAHWSVGHRNYEVRVSSTLPDEGEHHYGPENLRESGSPVWSEGAPGPGRGEWLELEPEVAKPLTMIGISPGFAGSEELFTANARPRRIAVELNGEFRFEAGIEDADEHQLISTRGYEKPVEKVRITFLDVWEGTRYEDMCVSSIRLFARLEEKPELRPSR